SIHVLAGKLTLDGLLGLLASVDLLVSNDSGPLHLAAAAGTPTVGIYWAGNLANGAPFTRARHRPLASSRTQCPVCHADVIQDPCPHRASLVADVPVGDALAACRELLAQAGERRHHART